MTASVDEQVRDLAERIVAGHPGAVARGISWCEEGGERAEALLAALPSRVAPVVGLTGPPGAGKSTLVNALVREYRAAEVPVGVVAVDPSSPISGGALLGDRVRLDHDPSDRGVFFRSLASRGATGGLSNAARAAARVLSAAGFGVVVIETVGAGQAEVEIMRVADTVAVVLHPGAGDEMQALKAGMMEIADVYVLNKADRPGIGDLKAHVAALLRLGEHAEWVPPVVETVASERRGIGDLVEAIRRHQDHLAGGAGASRAAAGARSEVRRLARAAFDAAVREEEGGVFARLDTGELGEVEAGRLLARLAAGRVASEAGEREG
ncbi:MAG: methylmalonyl Co-A mutase-associated GTPase MeaB [Acidimicrobiia bacterium]|nr:methylmalonyl Co-A mutase-associated GTPase MeaB [Acidimicrobiia bacterium]